MTIRRMDGDEYVTGWEVANLLDIACQTFAVWRRAGKFTVQPIRRRPYLLFSRAEVDEWIAAQILPGKRSR